jgi:hypothetical protein
MRRLACLALCLAALAAPASAVAQTSPFGPLPEPAPEATPLPENTDTSVFGQDVGRSTLYLIGGGFLVFFIGIGWFISRDARRALPRGAQSAAAQQRRADPKERHRRQREKERARKKTRAQRQARKAHRKR